MRVLMFHSRFADLVRSGQKAQTIRPSAKCIPGEVLNLCRWTGLPHPNQQEPLLTEYCTSVKPITLTDHSVIVAGHPVWPSAFAKADGFKDWNEMVEWFVEMYGLSFSGDLISWKNQQDESPESANSATDESPESARSATDDELHSVSSSVDESTIRQPFRQQTTNRIGIRRQTTTKGTTSTCQFGFGNPHSRECVEQGLKHCPCFVNSTRVPKSCARKEPQP